MIKVEGRKEKKRRKKNTRRRDGGKKMEQWRTGKGKRKRREEGES